MYMGICYHGTTTLKSVTGTHKQVSKYTNPKIKQPHTGVKRDDYTDILHDNCIPEGNRLFQHAGKWANNWQLQQLKDKLEEVRQSIPVSLLHSLFDGMLA